MILNKQDSVFIAMKMMKYFKDFNRIDDYFRARKIERFLSQPFHVAEVFTGSPGVFVSLEDTIKGFKDVCDGKHDDLPEAAFYMCGTIDQVIEKANKFYGKK